MPLDRLDGQLVYEPDGPVLAEFLQDRSKVAVICGPIGSGTSSVCCHRIWATACEQEVNPETGKRHSRWGVVRPTYPELLTSTLDTWLSWFPEAEYGDLIRSRPMNHRMKVGEIDLDAWFIALDGLEDAKKLRSTLFTGFWLNELEFQTYDIFHECRSRSGRYPEVRNVGPTWSGIIADMNAPNEEHFLARMAGWADWPDETPEEKRLVWPKDWWLKKQPAGLIEVLGPDGRVTGYVANPGAENQKWLEEGYYLDKAKGATKQWIDARIMNRVTFITDGDPVWPNFRAERHLASGSLPFVPGREVIVALDFGRRPCAIIAQEIGDRIQIQRELRMYGVGATVFAPALKRFLEQHYRGATIRFTGDPKGADRGQATEKSAYDIFRSYGMSVTPAPCPNNELSLRLEAVSYALETSRILIGTGCPTLRSAVGGKYCLRKLELGDAEPIKDKYSDVADCLQYLCLFLGEGRRMAGLTAAVSAQPAKFSAKRRSMRRIMA